MVYLREFTSNPPSLVICGPFLSDCLWLQDCFSLLPGEHNVCLHAVEAGALGLAIAELQTGSPADWLSATQNPSGVFGAVFGAIGTMAMATKPEHKHLVIATPRLLDVLLDGLKAYEATGSAESRVTVPAVFWGIVALYNLLPALFSFSDVNRTAVRGVSPLRNLPLLVFSRSLLTDCGVITGRELHPVCSRSPAGLYEGGRDDHEHDCGTKDLQSL